MGGGWWWVVFPAITLSQPNYSYGCLLLGLWLLLGCDSNLWCIIAVKIICITVFMNELFITLAIFCVQYCNWQFLYTLLWLMNLICTIRIDNFCMYLCCYWLFFMLCCNFQLLYDLLQVTVLVSVWTCAINNFCIYHCDLPFFVCSIVVYFFVYSAVIDAFCMPYWNWQLLYELL